MIQYWYRAVEPQVYTVDDFEELPLLQRQHIVGALVRAGTAEVLAGLDAGTLADPRATVYFDWYNLDAQGRREADELTERTSKKCAKTSVTQRRATPNRRHQLCSGRCARELPLDADHFHRHVHARDGFRARCIKCTAADRRDATLVERLGRADVTTVAAAYRKGRQDGEAPPCGFCGVKGANTPLRRRCGGAGARSAARPDGRRGVGAA